tara:strand:- start:12318 stop:12719 length:402 start_codon:yes stop_codon:yes gene_type:complete
MLKKRLKLIPTVPLYVKEKKPETNDDLIQAKIFTYGLQVDNALATMVRNGLLSIRIAFLFYMHPQVSPWVGKSIMFLGATVILGAVLLYTRNVVEIVYLTQANKNIVPWSIYIWPILCSLFSIIIYVGSFELL